MATREELQDEIQALKKQIEKYKLKFQDEVELKRQCEDELRKREEGGGTASREWRAGSIASISSSTSSASSSTSTTPQASSDAVPTRASKTKKEKKSSGSAKEKRKSKTSSLPRGLQSADSATAEDAGRGRSECSATATSAPVALAAAVAASAAGGFFTVRAIETYKAASKGELSFTKGTTITVLEENEADGLFKGQIGKKEGWFPSFYVVRT